MTVHISGPPFLEVSVMLARRYAADLPVGDLCVDVELPEVLTPSSARQVAAALLEAADVCGAAR